MSESLCTSIARLSTLASLLSRARIYEECTGHAFGLESWHISIGFGECGSDADPSICHEVYAILKSLAGKEANHV